MKRFEIPMVVTSLVGLCCLAGPMIPAARADFTFGEPVDLQSTFPFLDVVNEWVYCFSADGLEAYISSNRAGGQGAYDLWVCRRTSPQDDWGLPENLGPVVNTASTESAGSLTGDGLELYFNSDRPGGYGQWDLWVTRRTTRDSLWDAPTNLGSEVNGSYLDAVPWVSSDGLELYFLSGRPGGYGVYDIYVSRRATRNDPWGPALNLGPAVNGPTWQRNHSLSPDGLLLFFESNRSGGYGSFDVWMTRRASRSAPWESAVNLGPVINGPIWDMLPYFAPDGSALYFVRATDSGTAASYWQAPIFPIVDFNADNKVDLDDLMLLIDNWGTDNTLYDIGPFAWGDGKVDVEDLKAFITEWEKESPPTQP